MAHIICTNISDVRVEVWEKLYARAAAERRAKADRYRRREDKLRCIAADALLRCAVERMLGIRDFSVEHGSYGKPRLKTTEPFCYNLSHSGSWVVIAFGETEVGIDVEEIQMDAGKESIARRYFTAEEQAYVFSSEEERGQRFFQVWTGKESYLKYLGTGLCKPLESFSVLSLEKPRLTFHLLEGGYGMTLCSEDGENTLEQLSLEQLL